MDKICEKMISMVDFDRFLESVKVTIGRADVRIEEKYVRLYLENWAKAKRDLFIRMGEVLRVEKNYKYSASPKETDEGIDELKALFPHYAANISVFNQQDLRENKFDRTTHLSENMAEIFPEIFKKGMKITKILSTLLRDDEFDIAFSKVYQNKSRAGKMVISIDPLDYILLSTNNKSWNSCMEITGINGGFNRVGGFSLMLDNVSVIGTLEKDKNFTVANNGGSFEYHEKLYRQLFFVGEDFIIAGHCIMSASEDTISELVEMSKDVFFKDGGLVNISRYNASVSANGEFYYDTYIYDAFAKNGTDNVSVKMGVKKLWSVKSGKEFTRLERINYNKGYLVFKEELG